MHEASDEQATRIGETRQEQMPHFLVACWLGLFGLDCLILPALQWFVCRCPAQASFPAGQSLKSQVFRHSMICAELIIEVTEWGTYSCEQSWISNSPWIPSDVQMLKVPISKQAVLGVECPASCHSVLWVVLTLECFFLFTKRNFI